MLRNLLVFSQASGIALGMALSVVIAMKICAYIHAPQRITHNDFGDPLTFRLAPQ